jgi:hypothetical protein
MTSEELLVFENQPFLDSQHRVGSELVARCHGCGWAQIVDQDLHDGLDQPAKAARVCHASR